MATHSSVLAWRIPGTGEPDGLPSLGSHRVGHNWSDLAAAAADQTMMFGRFRCCCVSRSVQFSRSVVSDSLRPHESQHARLPCPSTTTGVHSNSRLSSQWCHPAISFSVIPFSTCPQSLPASGSFPMSQLFAWGGQSIGVSALVSVLPKNTQDWSPLFFFYFLNLFILIRG